MSVACSQHAPHLPAHRPRRHPRRLALHSCTPPAPLSAPARTRHRQRRRASTASTGQRRVMCACGGGFCKPLTCWALGRRAPVITGASTCTNHQSSRGGWGCALRRRTVGEGGSTTLLRWTFSYSPHTQGHGQAVSWHSPAAPEPCGAGNRTLAHEHKRAERQRRLQLNNQSNLLNPSTYQY